MFKTDDLICGWDTFDQPKSDSSDPDTPSYPTPVQPWYNIIMKVHQATQIHTMVNFIIRLFNQYEPRCEC